MRIIYMGTPDFAVAPLLKLIESKYNVVAVITMPDKPAGRGHQLQESPVKIAANRNNIPVLQPEKLKDETFLQELASFNADLQIVVAFRMLPKQVWSMPKHGTFNLHASLLPNYRGAAPINWAVINGETETGVTTFFINEDIDTGNILFREVVPIKPNDNAGSVHDKLMEIGAKLVVKTVSAIEKGSVNQISQEDLLKINPNIFPAPKIFKEDCLINWNTDTIRINNFIRGFSPFPGAWTVLKTNQNEEIIFKIFSATFEIENHKIVPGTICNLSKKSFKIATSNGYIIPIEVQLPGKKRMILEAVLQGMKIDESFKF